MIDKQGKKTLLYNLAPNGLKIDQVYLTEVPNVDNSGVDYLIEYIEDFIGDEKIPIGHCELILGNIWFDTVGKNAKTLGINFKAMKLPVNRSVFANITEVWRSLQTTSELTSGLCLENII